MIYSSLSLHCFQILPLSSFWLGKILKTTSCSTEFNSQFLKLFKQLGESCFLAMKPQSRIAAVTLAAVTLAAVDLKVLPRLLPRIQERFGRKKWEIYLWITFSAWKLENLVMLLKLRQMARAKLALRKPSRNLAARKTARDASPSSLFSVFVLLSGVWAKPAKTPCHLPEMFPTFSNSDNFC